MINKGKIYLCQFAYTIPGTKITNLPYSAAKVWAYAESQNTVTRSQLGKLIFFKDDPKKIVDSLDNPAVFGLSCYVWNSAYSDTVARLVKEKYPDCLIIYGGPSTPDDVYKRDWDKEHDYVDICVHQEGEITFNEIMKGTPLDQIVGISYKKEGKWVSTGKSVRIKNLDNSPSPYLMGLLDDVVNADGWITNSVMETDRGCPFMCTFCDWGGTTFSKIKKFNLETVFEEIEWAGKNRIDHLLFANANFGIFKERDSLIADKVIATKEKYGFPNQIITSYAKNSNEFIIEMASRLNKHKLLYAFNLSLQTLNKESLEKIKRTNMKINDFEQMVALGQKNNISIQVEIILGLPGETKESFLDGICYLHKFGNITVDIYPFQILPNSVANNDDYIQEHKLKFKNEIVECEGYHETFNYVYSTDTMPEEDFIEVSEWLWCHKIGITSGITTLLQPIICEEQNIDIKTFYTDWHNYIKTSSGILNQRFKQAQVSINNKQFNFLYGTQNTCLEALGYLRRQETLEDLVNFFAKTYNYSAQKSKALAQMYDTNVYNPAYNYPYEEDGMLIEHEGMPDYMKSYAQYMNLGRHNKRYITKITKINERNSISMCG